MEFEQQGDALDGELAVLLGPGEDRRRPHRYTIDGMDNGDREKALVPFRPTAWMRLKVLWLNTRHRMVARAHRWLPALFKAPSMPPPPASVLLVGAGAVEDSWRPVRDALLRSNPRVPE